MPVTGIHGRCSHERIRYASHDVGRWHGQPAGRPLGGQGTGQYVRIGMQSILSGPIALLGTSSRNGLLMEQDRINAAGGFLGRPIEFVFRNSKGQPQEAARVARELVNSTGCELLIDAEASSASFAVQEVVRDLGSIACIHTNSETSSLTADPKIRAPPPSV